MGAHPSKPTDEQQQELEATWQESVERAAAAIRQSDAFLLMTGAGWSADSGLAVYADVANIEAYHDRGLTYHDICQPVWLQDDPALFYGFWGMCFNDYRNVAPHEGYSIIARWRDQHFQPNSRVSLSHEGAKGTPSAAAELASTTDVPGAFFAFTSNVDAHAFQHFSE
jgi:hypothetical protein